MADAAGKTGEMRVEEGPADLGLTLARTVQQSTGDVRLIVKGAPVGLGQHGEKDSSESEADVVLEPLGNSGLLPNPAPDGPTQVLPGEGKVITHSCYGQSVDTFLQGHAVKILSL